MNWYAQANKGEGLEYFILLFGLAAISLIAGGGRASADAAITKGLLKNKRPSKTIIA
jgi:putative oxidoreductase